MGQKIIGHFTRDQRRFLTAFLEHPETLAPFYLTGGTALVAYHFNHRLSEDIDLFSPQKLNEQHIHATMQAIMKKIHCTSSYQHVFDRITYMLTFPSQTMLKVDFVFYDFKQLEKPQFRDGIFVDSIEDISVNKLLTMSQRTASKDYVDLYFILKKKYTVWDLQHGVEHKFKMEIEPFYLSSLFAKVSELTDLPIMKKTLTLDQLKQFFLMEAKRLASTMVKP